LRRPNYALELPRMASRFLTSTHPGILHGSLNLGATACPISPGEIAALA
jgi:hypothetical protein